MTDVTKELNAMKRIVTILESLETDAQRRVLEYLNKLDWYGIPEAKETTDKKKAAT